MPSPKVKLPRTQGRWSYKTTPKPRIAIRKQVTDDEETRITTSDSLTSTEPQIIQTIEEKSLQLPLTSSSPASVPVQKKIQEIVGPGDDELDPSETEEVSTSVQNDPAESILPVETINIEISTPADLNDVYFEIATIKSPYSFQVFI